MVYDREESKKSGRRGIEAMILVVDDDERLVNALRKALEKKGYRVECASDGVQAYQHLRSQSCKCMLLDMTMPRINGMELLVLMQTERITVPTIVITGFQDFEEEEMKQFTNVVKLLTKPFSMEEAVESVKECAQDGTANAEG